VRVLEPFNVVFSVRFFSLRFTSAILPQHIELYVTFKKLRLHLIVLKKLILHCTFKKKVLTKLKFYCTFKKKFWPN